jgi:hypothetical protein
MPPAPPVTTATVPDRPAPDGSAPDGPVPDISGNSLMRPSPDADDTNPVTVFRWPVTRLAAKAAAAYRYLFAREP